ARPVPQRARERRACAGIAGTRPGVGARDARRGRPGGSRRATRVEAVDRREGTCRDRTGARRAARAPARGRADVTPRPGERARRRSAVRPARAGARRSGRVRDARSAADRAGGRGAAAWVTRRLERVRPEGLTLGLTLGLLLTATISSGSAARRKHI